MPATMKVMLCSEAAAAHWGEKALLSFCEDEARVHVTDVGELLRKAQQAGRKLDAMGIKQVALSGEGWCLESRWAFAQGFYNAKGGQRLEWGQTDAAELAELDARTTATYWVREMINGTPEDVYPASLATEAGKFIQSLAPTAVNYRIYSGEQLKDLGYVGIYEVGRGSVRPPTLLELDFNPTGNAEAPVAACLVGKGITFDSGGYSIKPSDGMSVMKSDMGGAATVTGALALAIRRGLDKRIKLFLCCAENLVSGHAYKLGDILTYKNGISVEILNTDAEGRLVLADGLLAASATGAPFILDAATLTGAAKMALGRDYNAVFSMNDELAQATVRAAREECEKAWHLPLEPFHVGQLGSAFADMANVHGGEGMAGASTAAAFLSRFVPDNGRSWVHMDLSGSYQKSANDLWGSGGKGHGVRTIAAMLARVCEAPAS
ncbi:aminopeptidase PepB [Zobellella endophytica]|uniref:Aminopeptidase PepB n=1 Tax=Zobellella endophytica TaxID=2116700 RepID=A0A2P7QQE7_9GAMM|nr:aminopeptidase PepB [Zobellella endophytica]PSJ40196.1 aminopeptidase PepB [Zobellella endophytica]